MVLALCIYAYIYTSIQLLVVDGDFGSDELLELGRLGERDEVVERGDEAGRPVLGVPDVGEVGVVRVQQRGDGELVLRQQRRVLVGVQRRRQRRVDLCTSTSSIVS